MEFSKIIAVTGKPGLFHVISQTKNAIIAESLIDKKRIVVSAAQNVSLLENIAIYTYEEDKPLLDVFSSINTITEGKQAISHKESEKNIVSFFKEILPNYDEDRVYTSNIKKIIQWYNILIKSGLDFSKIEDTSNNTTQTAE